MPPRYFGATLENYKPGNRSQEIALDAVRGWTVQYPCVETGLLLHGGVGTGKSHLACAALIEVAVTKSAKCLFVDLTELFQTIKATYGSSSGTEENILRPVLDAEVLVLDDLGASRPTDWVIDTLTGIFGSRYNNNRQTIITSNHWTAPTRSHNETLAERVGIRIASRIFEMSSVVEVDGDDYRLIVNNPFLARARKL